MRVIINKFHVYGFVSHRNRLRKSNNQCSHFLDALFGLQKYYEEYPDQYYYDCDCPDEYEDYCEE